MTAIERDLFCSPPSWPASPQDIVRFWSYVEKADSCWLWQGSHLPSGYGRFSFRSVSVYAHRFSYALVNGFVVKGLQVCHSCDIPACVNPDHLWQGTSLENIADRDRKGRTFRGEAMANAVRASIGPSERAARSEYTRRMWREGRLRNSQFTPDDISTIRRLSDVEGLSRSAIARIYKSSPGVISKIVRGKTHRDD